MTSEEDGTIDENLVRKNLEKHRQYMGMHFDWKDMVIHYNLFTAAEVNDIKVKAKTDQREATELALDLILKSNIQNRFSVLIKALEGAGFRKSTDILKGACEPTNEFHRMIISCCQKKILENLDPNEILGQLICKDVIRNSDANSIRYRARMDGPGAASFELLTLLPKLHPDWYFLFVQTLKECGHDELANVIEERENHEAKVMGNGIKPSLHYKRIPSSERKANIKQETVGSDSAIETDPENRTKVTNCHKKCQKRRDLFCPKHMTRYCNFCHFSQHKPCSVFDLAYEVSVDMEKFEKDIKYLKACIAWRGEYRKEFENETDELIKDLNDEREKIQRQINSIVTKKNKACKKLDEQIEGLNEELKKMKRIQESRIIWEAVRLQVLIWLKLIWICCLFLTN